MLIAYKGSRFLTPVSAHNITSQAYYTYDLASRSATVTSCFANFFLSQIADPQGRPLDRHLDQVLSDRSMLVNRNLPAGKSDSTETHTHSIENVY